MARYSRPRIRRRIEIPADAPPPIGVTVRFQTYNDPLMPTIDGEWTQPGLWYVVALMQRGTEPRAYSGPYHFETEARTAMALVPVRPVAGHHSHPVEKLA